MPSKAKQLKYLLSRGAGETTPYFDRICIYWRKGTRNGAQVKVFRIGILWQPSELVSHSQSQRTRLVLFVLLSSHTRFPVGYREGGPFKYRWLSKVTVKVTFSYLPRFPVCLPPSSVLGVPVDCVPAPGVQRVNRRFHHVRTFLPSPNLQQVSGIFNSYTVWR